jgi:SsrA-binding protein
MAASKQSANYAPTLQNKKSKFEYHFIDIYEAGIMLMGTEVKSVRLSKVQLSDAYCYFKNGELFIKEMHISPYEFGNISNSEPRRERKLLLKRKDLDKLKAKSEEKGLTIIPTKMYFTDRGIVKVQIALAQGKKLYDKRQDMKDRDAQRSANRGYEDS